MDYFDHAATTWPRPAAVAEAMTRALAETANPGRSGHRLSLAGARTLFAARVAVAELLGLSDPRRVVLTPGCTSALNLVIQGIPAPGSHVLTTSMEHNSVARPLRALEAAGRIALTVVQADGRGFVAPAALAAARRPETVLAVVNHGSNVTGTLQDLSAIRAALPGLPLLVDAAQSAGHAQLPVETLNLEYVAIAGHKGLCGPPGIGALVVGRSAGIPAPLWQGGTGSRSESDRQPDFLPDALEAGTANVPGAAGLAAGIAHLQAMGPAAGRARLAALTERFLGGLCQVAGVQLHGPPTGESRLPVFSLSLAGQDPGRVALRLEREHGLLVRAGLHCAPWAHETMGTLPHGTVRFALGWESTEAAVDRALAALRCLAEEED